jgi:hypothetical protein
LTVQQFKIKHMRTKNEQLLNEKLFFRDFLKHINQCFFALNVINLGRE